MTEEVEISEALETTKDVAIEIAKDAAAVTAAMVVTFVVIPAVRRKVVEMRHAHQLKKEAKEAEEK